MLALGEPLNSIRRNPCERLKNEQMKGIHNDFYLSHTSFLLNRLKITSIALLPLSAFYLYADFFLYQEVFGTSFHTTLLVTHLAGFLASLFYLYLFIATRNNERFLHTIWPTCIILFYVILYIGSGAIASLNSYKLTGNHDAYLTIPFGVAFLLPIRPKHYLSILILIHGFFLFGLSTLIDDPSLLISKQVNTTISVFISFIVLFTSYSSLKKDFFHGKKQLEMQKNFRTLFEINPYPLFLSRLHDGGILLMNRMAVTQNPHIRQSASLSDLQFVFNNTEERLALTNELRQRGSIKNYTLKQELTPDFTRWVMVNYELIEYDHETCILSGVTDITQMKKMEEDLTQHASTDMLTGILNRRSGIALMHSTLSQLHSEHKESIICFVDLNNLKTVNDRYGHQTGDDMIKDFCAVVKQHLSTEDIFFRYGGDEFIILFYQKELHEAQRIWDGIQHAAEAYNRTSGKPYSLSASHGYYPYDPSRNVSLDEIIHLADQEMYKEKLRMKSMVK